MKRLFETSRQRGCFHPENKLFDETLVSVSFSWKHTFSARCQVVLHTGVNTLVSYVCFRATNYSFKTRVSHFYNCCSTSFWRFSNFATAAKQTVSACFLSAPPSIAFSLLHPSRDAAGSLFSAQKHHIFTCTGFSFFLPNHCHSDNFRTCSTMT